MQGMTKEKKQNRSDYSDYAGREDTVYGEIRQRKSNIFHVKSFVIIQKKGKP
tara:strand:+ start:302 stop:457 length:156 start_codon:yes stop_codon:yes gene_type:complete